MPQSVNGMKATSKIGCLGRMPCQGQIGKMQWNSLPFEAGADLAFGTKQSYLLTGSAGQEVYLGLAGTMQKEDATNLLGTKSRSQPALRSRVRKG